MLYRFAVFTRSVQDVFIYLVRKCQRVKFPAKFAYEFQFRTCENLARRIVRITDYYRLGLLIKSGSQAVAVKFEDSVVSIKRNVTRDGIGKYSVGRVVLV